MTENATPENRSADPERRYTLREWLIDALALGMGGLAVFHYQPEGFSAGLIVFVGAYTLTHSLQGPLPLICTAWIALLGIWIVARYMVVSERTPQRS